MVLAEDAAQVAAAEEDGAAAIVALETGLFAEVRGDCVDEDVGADEAVAGGAEAVHTAEAGAEVAVREVGVGERAFVGGGGGGELGVARAVAI